MMEILFTVNLLNQILDVFIPEVMEMLSFEQDYILKMTNLVFVSNQLLW